ncbi:replication initiation factor domain-containing protein [Enterococcus sp. AZ012]|uniref:replication initiation factor domain-containing protein n=1 Tax=Enterococcus sp. AZ012 TaxID=2774682 RepID=UPI003D288FBF
MPEVFNVKCDKLTLSGNISDSDLAVLDNYITSAPDVEIIGVTTQTSVRGKLFCNDENSVWFEFDKVRANSFRCNNFRLEFNPSKLSIDRIIQLKTKVLYVVSDLQVNRYDLAFDCDFDLSEVYFDRPRTKMIRYYGVDGDIETITYGTRNSDVFERIYNKNRQIEDTEDLEEQREGDWWRYELQFNRWRKFEPLLDSNFTMLIDKTMKIPDYEVLNNPQEELILTSMLVIPEKFARLHKNTKYRYRKKMREIPSKLDLNKMLNDALKKRAPELEREVRGWLKSGKALFK